MEKQSRSYGKILASTGIFGGSQLFNMFIGILRTKVVAVLLGPNGYGLMSVYQSIVDMLRSVGDLGLSFSAVRDLSAAKAADDAAQAEDDAAKAEDDAAADSGARPHASLPKTVSVFRRLLWMSALFGALLCLVFSSKISQIAFKDTHHVWPICLLSVAVFMTILSAGQRTILQGVRRIGDMARSTIWGSLITLITTTLLFLLFGEKAVIPALLLIAMVMLAVSSYYTRRLAIPSVKLPWKEVFSRGRNMLKLGVFTLVVSIVGTLSNFVVRALILNWSNLDMVGCYQACWSISSMAMSAVFTAMAADYYPRLCSISQDNKALTRSVNEQYRISVLLSSLVVMLMILFAPLVIRVFYSAKFLPTVEVLQWQMLACFVKVMNWPMAYVILSKGKGALFMLVEILWYALYVLSLIWLWPSAGLLSAGYAYLIAHVVYTIVVYVLVRRLCGFSMNAGNWRITIVFTALIAVSFLFTRLSMPQWAFLTAAALLVLLTMACLLWEFHRILPLQEWKQKLLNRFKKQ